MSGNYPAGVSDNDPHFNLPGGDAPDSEYEYQSRKARKVKREPDHEPDCKCSECFQPF